ncbi:MAG: hypothetical protein EBT08_19125, partial [Betaproteobacteria bacterium]|nr:hypothetical protein [Betaproteobacteria bacterium]
MVTKKAMGDSEINLPAARMFLGILRPCRPKPVTSKAPSRTLMTNPPLGGKTNLVTAPSTGLQRSLEWLPHALARGVNRLLILAATATLVAGCAAPQRNEAFAPVQQLVRDQLGVDLYWAT